ncbi:actin-like ATPase domain-containing protein [Decorospora gaudefroyi]|uniref:Actin-like ATPase domain-containing protein n=1 Tax=Decorospora gaudefroyi TaxID=184978 RepID=A0A6A5K6R9_9PLEO|nr:actin-like ATPase domain-containing protein [Decorospora gaudefroyi]
MASEIVVGIDFGTTYSGVSWAVNGGIKAVRVINDWPNPSSTVATSDKVPTIISYQGGSPQWGFSVDNVRKDSFRWIKLLLDPKNQVGRSSEAVLTSMKLLGTLNKTAEDVAADYLRMIWNYAKEDIQKVRGDDWESIYTLKCVLTVPAIWSPVAKEKTLKIARMAGLPQNLNLVTEPEAAALAVLKEKSEEGEFLEVGDSFVVCDAGGGTVDLISYKIVDLNPLAVEECAVGDGGLCGSVYLDQAFERYIKTIVGESEWNSIKDKSKKKMMREFELAIKRCYAGDDQEYSVDLQGVEDNPEEGIDDDTITLKPSVLKTVFDHVIGQIMRLVEKQIDDAQENGNCVKAILLVGGFGTNRYMHKQLKDAHKKSGIQVLQNNGAWSAICRGATLWGLENSEHSPSAKKTVRARIARYSYGLSCAKRFDESKGHRLADRRKCPDGLFRAINQMEWLLEKGDKVEEGKILHTQLVANTQVGLLSTGMRYFSDELYYCGDDQPPSRKEISVKELCKVDYGIKCSKLWRETSYRDSTTKQKWRDATFDLFIGLDSATLHFFVLYKGEAVAYTEAKYKEEF